MGLMDNIKDEFKKASGQEKLFVIIGVGATIGIALYLHNKGGGPAGPQTGTIGGSAGGAAGGGGIQTVPGPNGSQIPIIPGGLCPNFDAQGNLINYSPCGKTTGGVPMPPTGAPIPQKPPAPAPFLPVRPIIGNQPTTVTKTMAGRNSPVISKTPSYRVQGISPSPARVSAQRTDIQQLRKEQSTNTGANFGPPPISAKPIRGPY